MTTWHERRPETDRRGGVPAYEDATEPSSATASCPMRAAFESCPRSDHDLAVALIGGRHTAHDILVAGSYHVVATRVAAQAVEASGAMRRLLTELRHRSGAQILSMTHGAGGTLLIDATLPDEDLDRLVAESGAAAGVAVAAVVVHAETAGIPAAHARAHELLALAGELGYAPKLYRFRDLAIEFQLSRPGFARERLAATIDSLEPHPDLLATLVCHARNGGNRGRTARELMVHVNTIAARLARIRQLTGYDPSSPTDLWRLRSALVARAGRISNPGPVPAI